MIKLLSYADIISLTNACLGFLAIVALLSLIENIDIMRLSFSLILLALLADGLDGIIARKTKTSELGDYLEAMADMISMSIAPSVFILNIYFTRLSIEPYYQILLVLLILIFIVCSITRLSSFHLMKNNDYFYGLPASASTIFLLIPSFLEIDLKFIMFLIIVLSLATISRIKFPKPKIKINAIAVILILLTLIIGKTFNNIAPILLFFALAIYSLLGPIYTKKSIQKISK